MGPHPETVLVRSEGTVRLLVVEDEPKMARLLRAALQDQGHAVDSVDNGREAVRMATECDYDAIVLDVMIPPPDGFQVCRTLRGRGRWAPILLLTARDSVQDRLDGLDAGADDYLTKPFSFNELSARLRALISRRVTEQSSQLVVGDLTLDLATRHVTCSGTTVKLSPKGFSLLELFMRRPGEVLSRAVLLEQAWDSAYDGYANVVDVYIRYLRDRIDQAFGRESIETVSDDSYRLNPSTP
jgi:two-component system OmpR family response regulator